MDTAPQSDRHVSDHFSKLTEGGTDQPEGLQYHPTRLDFLPGLADLDRDLNEEEVARVLREFAILVLADDEVFVRKAVRGIIGDVRDSDEPKLPSVECRNGIEAENALKTAAQDQIQNGLFIFDNYMGGPTGLEVYRKHGRQLHPSNLRVLLSGKLPPENKASIKEGHLDLAVNKPPGMHEFCHAIAQTYLKKVFGPKATEESGKDGK